MGYFLFFKSTLPMIEIVRSDIIIRKYDIISTHTYYYYRAWKNRYVKRPTSIFLTRNAKFNLRRRLTP